MFCCVMLGSVEPGVSEGFGRSDAQAGEMVSAINKKQIKDGFIFLMPKISSMNAEIVQSSGQCLIFLSSHDNQYYR